MDGTTTFRLRELPGALPSLSVLWRRAPTRRVFLKQVYFSGVQSLPLVLLVSVAVAGILTSQLRNFGQTPREALEILLAITNDELAPLITAIVITARSSPAMASELATMQANNEVRLLVRLGIPVIEYLVFPRVFGMMVGSMLLSVYFAFFAAFAGSAFVSGAHMFDALLVVAESLAVGQVLVCLLKGALFGFAVALVACRTGLSTAGRFTEVPVAASRAVVRGLAVVMVIDLLWVIL